MRTAKDFVFRVWHIRTKDMSYETDIRHAYDIVWFSDDIVMQWTGLLDKNGKKIFEGDIVQFTLTPMTLAYSEEDKEDVPIYGEPIIETGYVYWANTGYWIMAPNNEYMYIRKEEVEVIGNIYENPELIKDKA
jgi:uncharacterized phage protein (TIGR01671 family)